MLQQCVPKNVWECPTFHVTLAVGSRHAGCYKEVLFYNKGDGNKKRMLGTGQVLGKRNSILAGKWSPWVLLYITLLLIISILVVFHTFCKVAFQLNPDSPILLKKTSLDFFFSIEFSPWNRQYHNLVVNVKAQTPNLYFQWVLCWCPKHGLLLGGGLHKVPSIMIVSRLSIVA